MSYVHENEDGAPMNAAAIDTHDPVIADGKMMVMDHADEDPLPFTDLPTPPLPACWCCNSYNGDYCTKEWNNMEKPAWWRETARDENEVCDDFDWDGRFEDDECP